MDINSIIDAIVNALTSAFNFIMGHPMYFVLIFLAIIAYAIASHLFFKAKGYQPRDRSTCILSIIGKERSLDYLQNFTHMPPEQIEIIKYLRQNESASVSALIKRYGRENVETLVRQEYILLR